MCDHHASNCLISSDCCEERWTCRRCHNERSSHVMGKIRSVRCKLCDQDQSPSNDCICCGVKFARYYCSICHIYSHHDAYHCLYCGRCHRGDSTNHYYCVTCRLCMPITGKGDHVSFHEKYPPRYRSDYDVNCVICLDVLKSRAMLLLRCGHVLHECCYNELIEHDHRCPLCYKSTLVDSERNEDEEAPTCEDEDADRWELYCHECEVTSLVRTGTYCCKNCKTTNTRMV